VLLPITGKSGQGSGKHTRGEVLHGDPRKDEEPTVVGDPVEIGFPLHRRPSDIGIPHTKLQGGSAKGKGRDGSITDEGEILQPLPEEFLVAKIMIVTH
jgi:hypothetical protein